jgi:hypothetical protein
MKHANLEKRVTFDDATQLRACVLVKKDHTVLMQARPRGARLHVHDY